MRGIIRTTRGEGAGSRRASKCVLGPPTEPVDASAASRYRTTPIPVSRAVDMLRITSAAGSRPAGFFFPLGNVLPANPLSGPRVRRHNEDRTCCVKRFWL
jgi:hypothetical protein